MPERVWGGLYYPRLLLPSPFPVQLPLRSSAEDSVLAEKEEQKK